MIEIKPYKNGFKLAEGNPDNLYESIYKELWNQITFNHNCWVDKNQDAMIIDAPTLHTYICNALGPYKNILKDIIIK